MPLQLAHGQLRGELEARLTDIALGDETLEGAGTDQEADLEGSGDPSRVDPGGGAVRGGNPNEGLHEDRLAVDVETGGTQGALVDTEADATVVAEGFPAVGRQGTLAGTERTGGEGDEGFLDAELLAEGLDDVHRTDELVVGTVGPVREHLVQNRVLLVAGHGVKRGEGELADVGLGDGGVVNVDLRLTTREEVGEAVEGALTGHELGARAVVQGGTDVGVHVLHHQLFQGVLSHAVGALVSREAVLHAHLRADAALGAERVAVLGRADVILRVDGTAEIGRGDERGTDQRVGGKRLLLDDGPDGVRDTGGEHSTLEHVDPGRIVGERLGDLAKHAVGVLGGQRTGGLGTKTGISVGRHWT